MKSSDAKASKCRLKFSSKISIFIRIVCSLFPGHLFSFLCLERASFSARCDRPTQTAAEPRLCQKLFMWLALISKKDELAHNVATE